MERLIKIVFALMIMYTCYDANAQEIDYFGQDAPGLKPEVFAPGIISTEKMEFYISFSDDGNLCLFISVSRDNKDDKIKYVLRENGKWGEIQNLPYYDLDMNDSYYILGATGKTIYFSSKRPVPGTSEKSKLKKMWKMELVNNQWQKPEFVDFQRDTDYGVGHPSITKDGSVYFYSDSRVGDVDQADIFYSAFKNGEYGKVQDLGSGVNTVANECDPFISPNEDYVLVATSKHPDGLSDDFDIYVSFKQNDDTWGKAINLGEKVNSTGREIYPRVSPDGKYIMFGSNRSGNWDIYWVDAKVIEEFR